MAPSTNFGKRLIPQILDELAAADPDRVIYSVAKSADISQGFLHVSAQTFAKAVDKTAWWLEEQVGKGTTIQPVGYIGPHDLRHILLTYACIKANYTALFLSPKNSLEGTLNVVKSTKCSIWAKPVEQPTLPQVEELIKQHPMKLLNIPETDDLLNAEDTKPYPFTKTFEEATQEPFCILHSSGSTGLPKPIEWSHGLIGTMDAVRLLPPAEGDMGMVPWTSGWNEGDRLYSSFPMSHGAGIIMDILIPSLFAMHSILGPAGVIPNIDLIESLADHGKIDVWSMVPVLVDELGETPEVLAKFKSSKFICASGGPISHISGSKVNDIIRVLNLTGTTEGLFIGNLWVDRQDFLYFAFHPYSGFEFKELEPGIYEHWVIRNEHYDLFQGFFHTFPDRQEINVKDLYVKHPTKDGHWAYKGRSDDLVVLSNGYKISPLETEALITTHPAIIGCLVVGTAKPQAALLIELKDPESANEELFESIWATIQRANASSLHKDQLHKDFVMFAEADKPFIRTDKGTIKRQATLALYNEYIDRFYSSRSEDEDTNFSIEVDTSSLESITNAVSQVIGSLSPAFENIAADIDLFNLGLDSLLVFRAIRTIKSVVGLHDQLAPRHLYANPTIARFSAALLKLVASSKNPNGAHAELDDGLAKMKELLSKYKTRQSLKMNAFDMTMPKLYEKLMFYIPLRQDVSFEKAFSTLQRALVRTIELIPALDSKIVDISEDEIGYMKGHIGSSFPVPQADGELYGSSGPRQLVFKDLSNVLPSFAELKKNGFVASAIKDELLLDAPWFPTLPADIMVAQASFVEGGCLLATGFHHPSFDGTGVITVIKAWGESCKFVDGDVTATCSWLEPESLNRCLPEVLWEQEGYARPTQEIDPATWDYLGLPSPEDLANEKSLVPIVSLPPAKPDRHLDSSMFLISAESLERLTKDVAADPNLNGPAPSPSDIVQAMFWRAMIRARYRVAIEHGQTFGPDDVSVLELPIDCRAYFSTLLPPTYMGNLVIIDRPYMSIEELCSPETSISRIAQVVREAVGKVRPQLVHDAFTLLQTVTDYTKLKYAFMRLDGFDTMITNLMLFPTNELSFGSTLFANNGAPDALRVMMDGFNQGFRLCPILPMREDGGVELLFGTFPEELEKIKVDEEFSKYATYMG